MALLCLDIIDIQTHFNRGVCMIGRAVYVADLCSNRELYIPSLTLFTFAGTQAAFTLQGCWFICRLDIFKQSVM